MNLVFHKGDQDAAKKAGLVDTDNIFQTYMDVNRFPHSPGTPEEGSADYVYASVMMEACEPSALSKPPKMKMRKMWGQNEEK
eukprot:2173350-Amphidinium_carterae.1